MNKKLACLSLASLAACFVAPSINAADNCNGRWNSATISTETLEVPKGHKVDYFVEYSTTTSDNSPNNAVGRCGGYAITLPDGKVKVSGICVRRTKEGDSWADEFALEPGATRGTWKLVQGTGVFANKNWSGWWEPMVEEGKVSMGKWGGNCN